MNIFSSQYHLDVIYSFALSKGINIFLPFNEIILQIKKLGYKIRPFKISNIKRVEKTINILNGLEYNTHLDVGSGRGNFIFPYVEDIVNKDISLTIVEQLEKYCDILKSGLEYCNIDSKIINANFLYFSEDTKYDIITLLEVLEHIPEWELALNKAIQLSSRYIVISVPSKEDSNPEHLHLITPTKVESFLDKNKINCTFKINGVSNHWIYLIIKK